jgi:hypothetical protein
MAYKRLAAPRLGDLHQVDGKPCFFEDRNSELINIARDWLVARLKGVVNVNGQDTETIRLSVNLGQVSTFISECCTYDSSSATERLDFYIDYRDWCFQCHLCPVSIRDFERTLAEFGFRATTEKSASVEKAFWTGIEPSGYWYFVNDLEFFSANRISQSDTIPIEAE